MIRFSHVMNLEVFSYPQSNWQREIHSKQKLVLEVLDSYLKCSFAS